MRIISYNVLSSELSTNEEFPNVPKEHLEPAARLEKLLRKLEPEIQHRSIICLQEVTPRWHNALHTWFNERGYYITSVIFSPCLGVSIACPTNATNKIWATRFHPQFNSHMLILKIDGIVTIANVHIPCEYRDQQLMTDLCRMAAAAAYAHGADVICGDFNSRPSSEAYRYLSTKWQSAMMLANGKEPDVTCRAAHAPLEDFALDYIWLSKMPKSVTCQPVYLTMGLLPNEDEPSDHLMISAEIVW